ncbi:hypothetical protein [Ruegeria atlantica]|uniref:hypothetical protein n=1 Tax=Ruegeria atlantica TaxID=81569 RepID=UPI00147DAFC9|nr:hypothetical protein [Ruegeria atlantica]
MRSRPNKPSAQFGQVAPAGLIPIHQKERGNFLFSRALPETFTGFLAAGLVTFVLWPLISALARSVSGDLAFPVDLVFALGIFGATAAFALRGQTPRALLGRGLVCLGIALIVTPVGLSVLFALYLHDWSTIVTGTAAQQPGNIAVSLFGGVFFANAFVLGSALGSVTLLIGRTLIKARSKPLLPPYQLQSAARQHLGRSL